MRTGYLRLYRKTLESDVWQMSLVARMVFFWLLMSVNYKPKITSRGIEVKAGEIVTSYRQIAEGISPRSHPKVTVKQVRVAIDALSSVQVVSKLRATSGQGPGQGYLHLKLLQWDTYQAVEGQTKGQGKGQTEGRPRARTKEVKKERTSTNVDGRSDFVADWVDAERAAGREPTARAKSIFGAQLKTIGAIDSAIMKDTISRMVENEREPTVVKYVYGDCKRQAEGELLRMGTEARRVR